jgi:hypothetical protein
MSKQPTYRPGEKAPVSGQYPVLGPRGGPQGTEVTVTRGEPFPPTPDKGMGYGKPDKTKHKR